MAHLFACWVHRAGAERCQQLSPDNVTQPKEGKQPCAMHIPTCFSTSLTSSQVLRRQQQTAHHCSYTPDSGTVKRLSSRETLAEVEVALPLLRRHALEQQSTAGCRSS